MYFCQRVYNPIKTIKIVFNTYSYIFTLSNTIKIIIICCNITHLLLLCVAIAFNDFDNSFRGGRGLMAGRCIQ